MEGWTVQKQLFLARLVPLTKNTQKREATKKTVSWPAAISSSQATQSHSLRGQQTCSPEAATGFCFVLAVSPHLQPPWFSTRFSDTSYVCNILREIWVKSHQSLMNTWEFHITLSAKLTFRSIRWLQACWTAAWTPPSASKDGPCAWECSGGFFDDWVTTNLFASSHNWSLILSSSWPESPELYYTKVLLPTCPLEKLAINTITVWSPWVCFLCASASLNFKFIDCQWPWLPLKPFSSLRIIWEDQEGLAAQSSLSGKQLCVEETLEGVISAETHTRDRTSNVKHHFCSCMRKR